MSSEIVACSAGELLREVVARPSRPADRHVIAEADAKRILAAAGIAVPAGVTGTDLDAMRAGLRGPFVLKAVSPTLVHKSDAGGVAIDVDAADLADVAARMRTRVEAAGHDVTEFLLEEMASGDHEVVVGAVRTPGFGWAVMVGLGGVFVEVLEDVAFGLAPLDPAQIMSMLEELRGLALLRGARGGEPADLDALVALIEKVAGRDGLLAAMPEEITEIDLNPVKVGSTGAVAVDARFVVDPHAPKPTAPLTTAIPPTRIDELFQPRSVAVLGASTRSANAANLFIRNLKDSGFEGRVVPVHPQAAEIEGLPSCSSLAEAGAIDYAFVALPAARVAAALDASVEGVSFAQVVSSGFSEVDGGDVLEHELVETARRRGTRIIGPNSLGTHSSRGRVGFIPNAPFEAGGVAVISQSGGLSVDILRLGSAGGIAFHSVTSIGNSSDVSPAELAGKLLDDPEVSVIGLYLESLVRAREVVDLLATRPCSKPIVLLAGGRSREGSRAAASHTGALSGNHRLWPAVARQAQMTLVDTIEDFLAVLLGFDAAKKSVTVDSRDVVLFGNGGGASVLATDTLELRGLRIPTLPDEIVDRLRDMGLPPGNGLTNPIDVPAGTLAVRGGAVAEDILRAVTDATTPAVVLTHLNVGIIQRNLEETHGDVTGRIIETVARLQESTNSTHHVLVLKGDGKADMDERIREYAQRARTLGLPAHGRFDEAAVAVAALIAHQERSSSDRKDH